MFLKMSQVNSHLNNIEQQAGAELCQAQVKLEVKVGD